MAVQGGYTLNHGVAYAGMLADTEVSNTVTRLNGTAAAIPFGRFVAKNGFGGMQPATALSGVIGVTRRLLEHATPDGGAFAVQPNVDGAVVTMGSIWVEASETLTATDFVTCVFTAGANQGKAAKAATAADAIPNVSVVGFDANRQLVQLSIRIGG